MRWPPQSVRRAPHKRNSIILPRPRLCYLNQQQKLEKLGFSHRSSVARR